MDPLVILKTTDGIELSAIGVMLHKVQEWRQQERRELAIFIAEEVLRPFTKEHS